MNNTIKIYTDGSCNTQSKIGVWAAILFINNEIIKLYDVEENTTNNRMELTAVIKSIEYIQDNYPNYNSIELYTDSQYVEKLPSRAEQLIKNNFITKKGSLLQNTDLIKRFYELLKFTKIQIVKVKAHQKSTEEINYNREVDKLTRKILRNYLK